MTGAEKRALDWGILTALAALLVLLGMQITLRYEARKAEAVGWEALYALRSAQIAYREDPRRGAGHYAKDLAALGRKTSQDGLSLMTTDTYSEVAREGVAPLRLYHNGTTDVSFTR